MLHLCLFFFWLQAPLSEGLCLTVTLGSVHFRCIFMQGMSRGCSSHGSYLFDIGHPCLLPLADTARF